MMAGSTELVKDGPLSVPDACRAARDAARGLAVAHAAGLVHRDVKPGNLIRNAAGITQVLDFGLVIANADKQGDTPGEKQVIGTPAYIAPEQIDDADAADARADVYSLGCTLYHLLSGKMPFPSSTAYSMFDAHRDPDISPAPLSNVPPALAAVVGKMMAKKPDERFQTATEVANALEPFCQNEPPAVRRWSLRRWFAIAASLLLLLVMIAVGVVLKVQRNNEVITIETDNPDIEVVMKRNGELVRIVDTKTKQTWELDTKNLRLKPDGSELSIDLPEKEPLVIRRNGESIVPSLLARPCPGRSAGEAQFCRCARRCHRTPARRRVRRTRAKIHPWRCQSRLQGVLSRTGRRCPLSAALDSAHPATDLHGGRGTQRTSRPYSRQRALPFAGPRPAEPLLLVRFVGTRSL